MAAAGALASSSGSILGSIFGTDDKPAVRVAAPGLAVSPTLQAAQFENLLQYGIIDPSSLMQASPISRLISEVYASPLYANDTKGEIINNIQKAYNAYQKYGEIPWYLKADFIDMQRVLEPILQAGGYTDVNQFFEAQNTYVAQVQPLIQQATETAQQNFQTRLDTQQRINAAVADLPGASATDIANLSAAEKERYLRELNQAQQEMLAVANAGNFNPGKGLEQFAELRSDADLEAMNRALAIIGGQQTVSTNYLNQLQGYLNPAQSLATAIGGTQLGTGGGAAYQGSSIPNTIGPAVAQAGSDIGNALAGIGGLYYNQNLANQIYGKYTPPATGLSTRDTFDYMNNF